MQSAAQTKLVRPFRKRKFDLSCYRFIEVFDRDEGEFDSLLTRTYAPLGFLNEHSGSFLPRAGTRRYLVRFGDETVGSCAITPVDDADSVYHRLIPTKRRDGRRPVMIELNNIVLVPHLRGGIGLALILYNSALLAGEVFGAEMVVGITRYQTLRYFVEAGATPLCHEPLHVLGKDDIHDFIIYFDLADANSHIYLHERAKRVFTQSRILGQIRRKMLADRRTRGGGESNRYSSPADRRDMAPATLLSEDYR